MACFGPGFRFHPTDEELVVFYLKRKMTGKLSRYDHIAVVDVYKLEPWDLPSMSKLKTKDLEWYFFSGLDRKYGNGSRTNRATEKGYWKTTGKDRPVIHGERVVGMKKTLVYHVGRAPNGRRTNWVMHEYKMQDEELARVGTVLDMFVVCRIFEKSGAGPKNGAKYGAPLDEKEWDVEEEEEEKEVAPLPATDNLVAPLPVPSNVVAPLPGPENVVAPLRAADNVMSPFLIPDDEVLDAVSTGAYVETDDLDTKLDLGDIIGSVTFPLPNFHHGECSTHAEHSQVFIKDQEPLAITFGVSGPENGEPLDMAEQHDVGTDSVKDGDSGELSDIGNLLNFNDPLDDMDLDLYLDAVDNLPMLDDGSFLETNDLTTVNEGDPTEADPYAMVDEYLALPDDDVYDYIDFDLHQNPGSENFIPYLGSPFTEQNVEGETTANAVASKHGAEAQSSKDAYKVRNPKEANFVPENTNPFVKQAYGWLGSIPAAPAHAAEFPAAHITTGMISITDITFRGSAMDWTVGKTGGYNTLISPPGVNSAGLMPVSGKTAFVLSHGWIFVTGFSVLLLSLTFKIGSIMYTGK